VGVAPAIVLLFIFKYWNFFAGLAWFRAPEQQYWAHAFLPLGIAKVMPRIENRQASGCSQRIHCVNGQNEVQRVR
jgi:hypothetical protein